MKFWIILAIAAGAVWWLFATRGGRASRGKAKTFPATVANTWTGHGGTLPASVEGTTQFAT